MELWNQAIWSRSNSRAGDRGGAYVRSSAHKTVCGPLRGRHLRVIGTQVLNAQQEDTARLKTELAGIEGKEGTMSIHPDVAPGAERSLARLADII